MIRNNEYDALGELFRQRLENHRILVDGNGWNEIELRLNKKKKKTTVWLWSVGAAALAASIALLLVFQQQIADENPVMTVSQQIILEESKTDHSGTTPNSEENNIRREQSTIYNSQNPVRNLSSAEKNPPAMDGVLSVLQPEYWEIERTGENSESEENEMIIQLYNDAVIEKVIPKLDISLVADQPDEEEEPGEKGEKWLFAAAFGARGSSRGFDNLLKDDTVYDYPMMGWGGMGKGNDYASERSGSIQSFNYMRRDDFTNIQHSLPISFGITARKSLGKNSGLESGLEYTYLSSRFKWGGYDVNQSLHYLGIPVYGVVYLGNSNSNWRIYLSGGFILEKGLRARYVQKADWGTAVQTTTIKSSIDGLQWSLNGALGIIYRLEKGWGIYFEPRIGYSFDCNQPISVRTEMPVFFGINMGLNFEL